MIAVACTRATSDKPPATSSSPLAEATCAGCHAAQADEWRGSMHHASFTSADFQRSYHEEPRDYCVSCHAPLDDKTAGIGCTACHATDAKHASKTAERTHATTKACKSCHDFDIPGARTVLQATEREHRESAFAERSCESCHMKTGHRFDVTRNRDFLAKAIRVEDARIDASQLVVRVASHGVGHRFPTGDLFRRLTVVVAGYGSGDALVCADTFHFGRSLDEHRSREESSEGDTRLGREPRDLRVACTKELSRVHVTVTYERGSAGRGEELDTFATLDLIDRDIPLR